MPSRADPDQLEFLQAWTRLCPQAGAERVQARLREAWAEPQRHYHDLKHLGECLGLLRAHRERAERADELLLALWFHDAIYDPRGKHNELRSADWAAQALREGGADQACIERIRAHILATCHQAEPAPGDQSLLVDIDLAILGAEPERFAEYERQIRAEYAWVPGFVYRYKRRQILREFAERRPLYRTPALREQLEAQARENLTRALA
jgi:predicted metal-dependent HD superfamily phosphohydrolase